MSTHTISASGGTRAWSDTATWDEVTVPIAGDAVVARGGGDSGNVTISGAAACASIILTNYTGTLTYNSTLTTTSTVTYPAGMTVAGTSQHITVTGSTITISCASGLTGGLQLGGTSQTYTLGSNWVIAGTLLLQGTTSVIFSGAHNITCGALSVTMTLGAITMSGNLTVTGDAALSSATSTTLTGGGFTFQAATCTVSNGQTVTLSNVTVTITGLTTSSTVNVFNGGTWNTGGLSVTGATTGMTVFNLTGGTWSGSAALSCSVTIAGNVTLSGTILYAASGTPTITYSSGTVTQGTSVLSIASACTLNTAGMTWYSITISAALTLTINSLLSGTGVLLMPNAAVTLAGTAGFTFASVDNTAIASSGKTYTLTAGNTYRVTGELSWSGATAALTLTLISSHASNKVAVVVGQGCTQDVGFVVATRIDSTAGQAVFDYKGTLTTCSNWVTAYPVGANLNPPIYQVGI